VLAAFLLASGFTRLIGVFRPDLPHKFWPVLNDVLSIVLGILLWVHRRWTGLWFIGFAIAIELIFHGWAWVMVEFALRSRGLGSGVQPAVGFSAVSTARQSRRRLTSNGR
jgi:uncharacterized membrane protein HdeD (DUF308 family)